MMGIVLPRLSMGRSPQLGTRQSQVIMGHLPMVVWRLTLTLGFNQPSVGKVIVCISCSSFMTVNVFSELETET